MTTINTIAIAPTLIPSLKILSQHRITFERIQKLALELGIEAIKGNLEDTPKEFELYSDITDPGANFRNHFNVSLRFHSTTEDTEEAIHPNLTARSSKIEFRIFDEMIGIGTAEITIKLEATQQTQDLSLENFDRLFVSYTNKLFSKALRKIDQLSRNISANLQSRESYKTDIMDPADTKQPTVAWVHKIYLLTPEVIDHLVKKSALAQALISKSTLDKFGANNDHYGWGDSIKTPSNNTEWLDGCIISQYYYFMFDRFNRKLPDLVDQIRRGATKGKLNLSRSLGQDLRYRITTKDLKYADLLHCVAGETRAPIESYNNTWRIPELRQNLNNKLPLLQDALSEIHEKSQRISNSIIESILVFVSLLSLVSLLLSTHDYVIKPNKDKVNSLVVFESMAPKSLTDILSTATTLALLGMLIFTIVRFGAIRKLQQIIRKISPK